MRTFRPLYENFVLKEDIIQRRATRSSVEAMRKNTTDDAFEDYLLLMSKLGTYGGQPELLAFVRAYDQDVSVHLPPTTTWNTSVMDYTNEYREPGSTSKEPLHICYGGEEESQAAHYDSSQKSDDPRELSKLASRFKTHSKVTTPLLTHAPREVLSPRAIRNLKSDPSKDMMHELVTRGSKELRNSFDLLSSRDRARSPSVTSSHHSTSSKRSFEEDGFQPRATKRADRKRSLRNRAGHGLSALGQGPPLSPSFNPANSSDPPTPTSSQDTESSSDHADHNRGSPIEVDDSDSTPPTIINLVVDDSDDGSELNDTDLPHGPLHNKPSFQQRQSPKQSIPSTATEQSQLQTEQAS